MCQLLQERGRQPAITFLPRGKPQRIQLTDDTVLDPEYAKLIREARTKLGLSHEQLGIKMNEKAILLKRSKQEP